MRNSRYLLLLAILVQFAACKKEVTTTGFVEGTVYSANASKTISGANIFITAQGVTYRTQTNTQGYFKLEAPTGSHILNIETGKGKLFGTTVQVDIHEGQTLTLTQPQCMLHGRGQIAYIPGAYDAIQQIIIDSLGYTAVAISPGSLSTLSYLQTFDAVFINCGAPDLTDSVAYENLAQFVTDGGSLYVSDYAVSYLIGMHTGSCSRPLGFIDDATLCSVKSGSVVTLPGTIVAPDFQSFMGTSSMSIYYDLPQWEIIQSYDATYWEAVVTTSGLPALMLRKSDFTNGTSTGNSGNIYYTTFHNEPNGLINQDMQHMLEFVILNL